LVTPASHINRRFVSPGAEVNTCIYERHRVDIHDGRAICDTFNLDRQGFVLAKHKSAVSDFFDKEQVDSIYPDEVLAVVGELTGAKLVTDRGRMICM
jgi:hypothetical protein